MIQIPLVILSLTFIFLLIILVKLRGRRESLAIPEGQEVYQDLQGKGKILRSAELGISGKPDMIVRKGRNIIPYEYKRTNALHHDCAAFPYALEITAQLVVHHCMPVRQEDPHVDARIHQAVDLSRPHYPSGYVRQARRLKTYISSTSG